MGGLFGGGASPPPIPKTPPMATPPTLANPNAQNAGSTAARRAALAAGAGFADTITTGPQGLKPTGDVAAKALLGQ